MFVTSKVLANIDNIEPNVESLCFRNWAASQVHRECTCQNIRYVMWPVSSSNRRTLKRSWLKVITKKLS